MTGEAEFQPAPPSNGTGVVLSWFSLEVPLPLSLVTKIRGWTTTQGCSGVALLQRGCPLPPTMCGAVIERG